MTLRARLLLLCDLRGIKVPDALAVAKLVLDEATSQHWDEYGTEASSLDVWREIEHTL